MLKKVIAYDNANVRCVVGPARRAWLASGGDLGEGFITDRSSDQPDKGHASESLNHLVMVKKPVIDQLETWRGKGCSGSAGGTLHATFLTDNQASSSSCLRSSPEFPMLRGSPAKFLRNVR